jgi:hypothetical protein
MISFETARALSDGGLPGLIEKAKKAGGEPFACEAVATLLAMIREGAIAELGRTRARELVEMQLTAIERGGRG